MRVHEASDGLCLATKLLHSVASQPHLQDFDGGFSLQMNMLAEIHIGEATLPKQTDQAIVADLLSNTIFHFPILIDWILYTLARRLKKWSLAYKFPPTSATTNNCHLYSENEVKALPRLPG